MTDVIASFNAEWLKLRKRPAMWILGLVLPALLLILSYGLVLLEVIVLGHTRTPNAQSHAAVERALLALQPQLYPEHLVRSVLGAFTGIGYGNAIAVIVGVLAYGSEFGWSTLKTIFTQRPGRPATFVGKMLTLVVTLAIYVLAMFAAAAAASAVLGAAYGHLTPWPDPVTLVKAFLTAWLLTGLWAALGVMFAVVFRQAALAIGLGIVYAIAVEAIIVNVLGAVSSLENVRRGFPGANATALVESFSNQPGIVEPTQAVLVVLGYLLLFLAVSVAVLSRRDVI